MQMRYAVAKIKGSKSMPVSRDACDHKYFVVLAIATSATMRACCHLGFAIVEVSHAPVSHKEPCKICRACRECCGEQWAVRGGARLDSIRQSVRHSDQ